ncbi:MAG: hypothetical protein HC886_21995 [Leptolyngbyaceae cyanobacterium SM1_1_3]|nr:hypothetical protein [Leptolyngbyaceae cyanobacterium SM1_1_3]
MSKIVQSGTKETKASGQRFKGAGANPIARPLPKISSDRQGETSAIAP